MDNLKESEWIAINKVLLELYNVDDLNTFTIKLLKIFRMLIPYTKGYFILFDAESKIDDSRTSSLGMTDEAIDDYIRTYYEKDYMKYIYELSTESSTYRDTDILEDHMRKKTEFYQDFLYPNDIPFGAGIVLIFDSQLIGVVNLFRSGNLGDFSDKDMYIFDTLKNHITNIVLRLERTQTNIEINKENSLERLSEKYNFTNKEKEVAELILSGNTNAEISETMIISQSTVKKHIYNIFLKTGLKNRMQLSALLNS